MVESDEHKALHEIQVILALERNYLAEERTALAELRTGLTLTLISVPATTVVVFVFSTLPVARFPFLDLVNFAVFAILATVGIWMSLRSQTRLRKIKDKNRMLHDHKVALIRRASSVDDLLGKFIVLEEQVEDEF